jgi:NADPH:quinone reductase
MTMKAIQVFAPGGADALQYGDAPSPVPDADRVLVRVEAIGVNFIDVYHRSGLYPMPLPFIPGSEGAGVVVETGERVAWAMVPGACAEYALVPRERLVPLPARVESRTAAASMLQGMTAHYLVTSTFTVRPGTTALVHAAAGGAGGLLVQMAKQRGARVLATASTAKLGIARELGADVVIDYTREDVAAAVREATGGRGVDVAYDSVGLTTYEGSLDALAPRGMLVLFGQSSGVVPPIDPARFAKKSAFFTRPSLGAYTATREELLWRAGELFESIESGALRVRIDRELPLSQAAEAHRLLESRATSGKLLLIP